ncbi:Nif3-like dinuclear metal center protein [Candidatus Palibaumannia cicadellinicola]|uniref:GTP cyclohydrolase 1 type 2 homolog n=1 Tax=Candidatus Palibaumannia cicadellinicola TaxID=186490 RepID=A0A2N4XX73_9GAMM|nr:type 2 GTP cyclohydrolase I [Candidatus Baumannia cicadellinicola]PLK58930.1 Nif3-like dinuclear metal center protein [Candidatus Baumannia cicadellinicola]
MRNTELEQIINQKLNSELLQDYAPNGLQVEGCREVKRIVTGVTACQKLLDAALAQHADAVIVHHGYFWKNESLVINGMKRQRLKTLLANNINLYAWHLPLDAHPELGNNAQLAVQLGIKVTGMLLSPLVPQGKFTIPLSSNLLHQRLEQTMARAVLHYSDNAPMNINRLAWCSGGGHGFIELAAQAGMNAFISGEVSEQTIHIASEMGLHFYAAGHHATERGGICALGEWLAKEYDLDITFIDIDNPV